MARIQDIEKAPVVTINPLSNSSISSLEHPHDFDPPSHTSSFSSTTTVCPPGSAHDAVPDGGLQAWSQVLAGFFLSMVAWGYPAMFGVYQAYYTSVVLLPATQASWIGSTQTFLTYLTCTISGRLSDAGYARRTAMVGTILVVAGGIGTSLAVSTSGGDGESGEVVLRAGYGGLLAAQGVCTGLGLGLLTAPAVSVISGYFSRRLSVALATSTMGTSAGSAIFPAVVQYLIPRLGFAWAVRCSALLALVLCANACLLLRPRLSSSSSGVGQVGKATTTNATTMTAKKGEPTRAWEGIMDWSAFREVPYVLFIVASFLIFWALYFGFFYMNVYAEEVLGFSPSSSATLLILATALGVPTRPLVGLVADYSIGAMNTFVAATLFLGAAHFMWIAVATPASMYGFAVLFGLANGMAQGVWIGCLAALTRDRSKMGVRFGMVCTITAFATLAGPPTASAIIGVSGVYTWAQIWAGVAIVLGAVAIAAGRVYQVGWKISVKI